MSFLTEAFAERMCGVDKTPNPALRHPIVICLGTLANDNSGKRSGLIFSETRAAIVAQKGSNIPTALEEMKKKLLTITRDPTKVDNLISKLEQLLS